MTEGMKSFYIVNFGNRCGMTTGNDLLNMVLVELDDRCPCECIFHEICVIKILEMMAHMLTIAVTTETVPQPTGVI
jgi:hypothetical protein